MKTRYEIESGLRLAGNVGPCLLTLLLLVSHGASQSQTGTKLTRIVSGVVMTEKNEVVPNVLVAAEGDSGTSQAVTDSNGNFQLRASQSRLKLTVTGKYVVAPEKILSASEISEGLVLLIHYTIPLVHEDLVISATALNPTIDERNDTVYKDTLFSRDDQLMDTLAAGINTGQHEGGGKSLEIRRFGFNLDHGGVNGGLKVLVNDLQQNQGTQGHGQGYLGALKSLTPELIDDVDILNGPFSAEYGDFSGLGVVHIRLKEKLPDLLTLRAQGGSFNAYRGLAIFSPNLEKADAFIAYDGSHTDGPFINPGRYKRHIVTGNYTRRLNEKESLGFKLNFGTNDFYSSGQIPLDLVAEGKLDRFGFIDPFDGGRVRLGTFATYYKRDLANEDILKADGFLGRSLFDLLLQFHFLPRTLSSHRSDQGRRDPTARLPAAGRIQCPVSAPQPLLRPVRTADAGKQLPPQSDQRGPESNHRAADSRGPHQRTRSCQQCRWLRARGRGFPASACAHRRRTTLRLLQVRRKRPPGSGGQRNPERFPISAQGQPLLHAFLPGATDALRQLRAGYLQPGRPRSRPEAGRSQGVDDRFLPGGNGNELEKIFREH